MRMKTCASIVTRLVGNQAGALHGRYSRIALPADLADVLIVAASHGKQTRPRRTPRTGNVFSRSTSFSQHQQRGRENKPADKASVVVFGFPGHVKQPPSHTN